MTEVPPPPYVVDVPGSSRGDAWAPALRALAFTLVLTGLAWLADGWAYRQLHDAHVYDTDFGRMLRVMGFLGT